MEINQFIIDGNLTRAPEIRYTTSGMPVCTFTVANHTVYGSCDDSREEAAFIPITVEGKQADACYRKLAKGRPVSVIGRVGSWFNNVSKKGGITFKADRVIFRGGRASASQDQQQDGEAKGQQQPSLPMDDDNSTQRWLADFEGADAALTRAH